MNNKPLATLINNNAKIINQLWQTISSTHSHRSENEKEKKAWETACTIFHKTYDILSFPGGLQHGLTLLKQNNQQIIDVAIEYLNIDPYFYRSGYIKEKIAHLLKQASLNQKQIHKLQTIFISHLMYIRRRESRAYYRLIQYYIDETLCIKLKKIAQETTHPIIKARIQDILKKHA